MKTKLSNIVSIQTGFFTRPDNSGDLVYLQSKHFDECGNLVMPLYPDLKSDDIPSKHILKPGDVLFAAKGSKIFAALYEENNQPAVASTSFFIFRLKDNYHNIVSPAFLTWFMNHPATNNFLKEMATGSSMVSISKVVFSDLEIPIPTLELQQKIVKIKNLRNREKYLLSEISHRKDFILHQKLIQSTL